MDKLLKIVTRRQRLVNSVNENARLTQTPSNVSEEIRNKLGLASLVFLSISNTIGSGKPRKQLTKL